VTAKGDKTEITGLSGKYTQIKLEKALVGYVQLTTAAMPEAGPAAAGAPMAPVPVAPVPVAAPSNAPGTAAATSDTGPALARTFEGRFVSTHHAFTPRRPFDWALVDESGARLAYLDVSKLLFTDQIQAYNERSVAVVGTVRALPNGRDIVIAVESLELK
jgi:hypothetical protein